MTSSTTKTAQEGCIRPYRSHNDVVRHFNSHFYGPKYHSSDALPCITDFCLSGQLLHSVALVTKFQGSSIFVSGTFTLYLEVVVVT